MAKETIIDRDKYQLFITKFKSTLFYKIINLKYGGVNNGGS